MESIFIFFRQDLQDYFSSAVGGPSARRLMEDRSTRMRDDRTDFSPSPELTLSPCAFCFELYSLYPDNPAPLGIASHSLLNEAGLILPAL